MMKKSRATELWITNLENGSYSTILTSKADLYKKLFLQNFLALHINKEIKTHTARKILDFGAGGGKYAVPLAFFGNNIDALDCSNDVLKSLIVFKRAVEKISNKRLRIKVINGDMENFRGGQKYDFIFSVGVMEHFLDAEERSVIIQKMAGLLRKGGVIMTIVPSGVHPLRKRFRREGLAGYKIPEIDYDKTIFLKDFNTGALKVIDIYGYDLCGYLIYIPGPWLMRAMHYLAHVFFRLTAFLFTKEFKYRYSYDLICIAEKN